MRLSVITLVLAACNAHVDDSWDAPANALLAEQPLGVDVAPPPGPGVSPLTLDTTAVIPGEITTLTVTGALPSETVHFALTLQGVGAGPCPPPLGGLCLDLLPPVKQLPSQTADAYGNLLFDLNVPANAPEGAEVSFQALVNRGIDSIKSPPVSRDVQSAIWSNDNIVLDGDIPEWVAEEMFDTTSGPPAANWVTWDSSNLYVAFQHAHVEFGTDLHWTTIYVGTGVPGATEGVQHNTQRPSLPFDATYMIRWKADNSYNSLEWWDGAAWQGIDNYLGTNGSGVVANTTNQTVEFKLPRSLFATPNLSIHMAWVYEGAGYETTYSGSPSDSFSDGYDPDFSTFLTVDLNSGLSPNAQNP